MTRELLIAYGIAFVVIMLAIVGSLRPVKHGKTKKGQKKMKNGTAEIIEASEGVAGGRHFGRVVSDNGNELVRTSEGYVNKDDAENALRSAAIIIVKGLMMLAFMFTLNTRAQTAPPPPTPQQTFFDSVGLYFTSFNTNLLTFRQDRFELWTGVEYQQNVDVANVLGVDLNIQKGGGFYLEGTMANAGIAGTVLNLMGGGGYAIVKYDTRLSFGINAGFDFDIEKPVVDFYGDVRKSLTENTFAGVRLAYETSFVQGAPHVPIVMAVVGFTF